MASNNKPGRPAPASGQYRQPGRKTEITAIKGKPLPPTSKPGRSWTLVDKTKHKS
ncbi:YjzC family protein [Knoellia sp. p5-6-4]|uniref:YjzC family protein n=1 Tax=unclassified Knoellia TaxID=2618719 RepID=UPI0023DC61B9|nr:YjzC family protein [Knoellia sp. p5-6-4]MDF2146760.1 YjzC family protein [Knoellia sp. p5-6-4]